MPAVLTPSALGYSSAMWRRATPATELPSSGITQPLQRSPSARFSTSCQALQKLKVCVFAQAQRILIGL